MLFLKVTELQANGRFVLFYIQGGVLLLHNGRSRAWCVMPANCQEAEAGGLQEFKGNLSYILRPVSRKPKPNQTVVKRKTNPKPRPPVLQAD